MKLNRKVASVLLAVTMFAGVLSVPAMAAEGDTGDATQAATAQHDFTFNKVLDMTEAPGASVPTETFTFSIAPGTRVEATADSPEILAGPQGSATVTDAEFSSEDEIVNSQVSKTVYVDFDETLFTAPGIYRYVLTEEKGRNADISYNDSTYYVDVYVVNGVSGGYEVDVVKMSTNIAAPTYSSDRSQLNYTENTKVDSITNSYKTYSMTLQKVVTGSMADKGRDYNFTVKFTSLPTDATVTVTKNNTSVGTLNNGSVTGIDLKDGETITITGIPSTVSYQVVENIAKNDGYTVSATVDGTEIDDPEVAANSATFASKEISKTANNAVVVTNTKTAVTPTGLLMDVAPYAAMILLAAAAAFVFLRRRNSNED